MNEKVIIIKVKEIEELLKQFPFLKEIKIDCKYIPLEIHQLKLSDEFLDQSLLENESEAAGHFQVRKSLYIVRDNQLILVTDIKRSSTKIYPPQYLHPYEDYPDDSPGHSETIRLALDRQSMTEVQYIILYLVGSDFQERKINKIFIAPFKE